MIRWEFDIHQCLNRETRVWHNLLHPNILPFFGAYRDIGPCPAMVLPLCDNGSVDKYLLRNPKANRLTIVSSTRLQEIAVDIFSVDDRCRTWPRISSFAECRPR